MNRLDKDYIGIAAYILGYGNDKSDRTGTGTISVFGQTLRHFMSDGFPLLTTKKMFTAGIIDELIWFMRGETNIRQLVLKGVNIWNGDAYKKYKTYCIKLKEPDLDTHVPDENGFPMIMSEKEFVNKIKADEKFAKKHGELGRIYGAQWRNWRGTKYMLQAMGADKPVKGEDQLLNLIHDLKHNPDSRRLMVSSWKVDELEGMTLPPCHYHYQCYTRELSVEERIAIVAKHPLFDPFDFGIGGGTELSHKDIDRVYPETPKRTLSLAWNQRSVDTFLGLPFNIASYGFLLKILSSIVNMVPEQLIGFFGDTHIYKNHIKAVSEQYVREPYPLCEVELTGTFNKVNDYWKDGKFDLDGFINEMTKEDFIIKNYQSHPTIKAPLSN